MKWDGPMEYWLVSTGDAAAPGIDGGLSRRRFPGEGMSFTVDVESVDAAVKAVTAAGAQIVHPRSAIPGVGWLAYFKDPEGNVVGMMERDPEAK
jgi:predicted enzyme related to lactoylglutathione lyase